MKNSGEATGSDADQIWLALSLLIILLIIPLQSDRNLLTIRASRPISGSPEIWCNVHMLMYKYWY